MRPIQLSGLATTGRRLPLEKGLKRPKMLGMLGSLGILGIGTLALARCWKGWHPDLVAPICDVAKRSGPVPLDRNSPNLHAARNPFISDTRAYEKTSRIPCHREGLHNPVAMPRGTTVPTEQGRKEARPWPNGGGAGSQWPQKPGPIGLRIP